MSTKKLARKSTRQPKKLSSADRCLHNLAGTELANRIKTFETPVVFCHNVRTAELFWEFFIATLRSPNTQQAYLRACFHFADWLEANGVTLLEVKPVMVSAYIRELQKQNYASATICQRVSAIRKLFDYLIAHHELEINPATAVKAPIEKRRYGKTPVIDADALTKFFAEFPTTHLVDLRDRALIATMLYTFGRVSAVCNLDVRDYGYDGKQYYLELLEKGSKSASIPVHHKLKLYLDAYIEAGNLAAEREGPLFRSMAMGNRQKLQNKRLTRVLSYAMIKRRTRAAGLPFDICNHSFRGTGITTFMSNGGKLEVAGRLAGHTNLNTTKLYDHSDKANDQAEVERILI